MADETEALKIQRELLRYALLQTYYLRELLENQAGPEAVTRAERAMEADKSGLNTGLGIRID